MDFVIVNSKRYNVTTSFEKNEHVLAITFAEDIPESFGHIEFFTASGIHYMDAEGYDTIWKIEGNTVYLSDDGSVYAEEVIPDESDGDFVKLPSLAEQVTGLQEAVVEIYEMVSELIN